VGPGTLNPGRSVGPNTLTARQIRPLVDGNCGIDITRVTQPDQNRHAEKLQLRLKLTYYRARGLAAGEERDQSMYFSAK